MNCPSGELARQNDVMQTIVGFLGACQSMVGALTGLPARHLASFMDEVDEVWLLDSFLDQPDSVDAYC